MSFTEEQLKALMSLGNELESAKWIPITPIAEGFDEDVPKPARKKVRLSLAFMKENDSRIRASICEGSAVKPNIQTAGSSVTIIADTLLAVGGFPVPATSIANVICQLGLNKYCRG